MIKRILYLFFISIVSVRMLQGAPGATCVENLSEGKILEDFLRMGFEEEEYGYVLEGLKPISSRSFYGLNEFPISGDRKREEEEFKKTLLARAAIPIWNKYCSHQESYVLKTVLLTPSEPITSSIKVQFINVAKLNEVIENNIDLFRYVLGPSVQTKELVKEIAFSDNLLVDILNGDLVLIGIVLGFGSHNSLMGGRVEEIFSSSISKDDPPYLPKSQLMEGGEDHSLSILSAKNYGLYYLEFAGGKESSFRTTSQFSNLTKELRALDLLEEPIPSCLREELPLFIFGAYKGGPSNQPFFNQLKEGQKRVQRLLKHPNFLKEVLGKIGGKETRIQVGKESIASTLDVAEWTEVLLSAIGQFKEKEERDAFVDAFLHPLEFSQTRPKILGASRATLDGLKKALYNLELADVQFEALSRDQSLQVAFPNKLYTVTTQPGVGRRLEKESRVRLGYTIEDPQGEILFANCDTWISLFEAIPGLAYGIQGMQLGEKRTLYIHPSLGYGALTTLPPCIGLTIKVHLIEIDENSHGALPSLQPLDLDWIKDPSFYLDIKESVDERPRFTGAFYRTILGKVEGSDQTALINELHKRISF